jgi:hypothetical protein
MIALEKQVSEKFGKFKKGRSSKFFWFFFGFFLALSVFFLAGVVPVSDYIKISTCSMGLLLTILGILVFQERKSK